MTIENQEQVEQESDKQESKLSLDDVNKAVHAAITKREKAAAEREKALMNELKELKELFGQSKGTVEPKKADKSENSEVMAQLKALQEKLALTEKEKLAEKQARMSTDLENKLNAKLTQLGVMQHMIDPLKALMVDRKKQVVYNEDGELVFKTLTGDVGFEEGLNAWSKSQEAKAYIAAKQVKGSGATKTSLSNSGSQKQNTSMEDIGKSVFKAFNNIK